jgi:hypothetical protein
LLSSGFQLPCLSASIHGEHETYSPPPRAGR